MAKVEIYTTTYCPYCVRAKGLLDRKGAKYTEVNVEDDDARASMIQRTGGARTVPQIFINDKLIGGSDDLHALDAKGGLDPLLNG